MDAASISAIEFSNQCVQTAEHDEFVQRLSALNWSDLKLVLDTIEAGSFRAGAKTQRASVNTVRNRFLRIEDTLGVVVAVRSKLGLTPTDDGQKLLQLARAMRAMSKAGAGGSGLETSPARELRISVTEGLGAFWLMPRLVEFRHIRSPIRMHLNCDMRRLDDLPHDIDVAVQFEQPNNPELIVQRLGTLHLMPFATADYSEKWGVPRSIDEWREHRLVWQIADQVAYDSLRLFVGPDPAKMIEISTNSSSAHYAAVLKGAGIGILPTYARAISKSLLPINIGVHLRREIFCFYRPESKRSESAKQAISWLHDSFAGKRYPWFADKFIHPSELDSQFSEALVADMYENIDIGHCPTGL
jgi:DNA-binding transcriptional LysR family regulator